MLPLQNKEDLRAYLVPSSGTVLGATMTHYELLSIMEEMYHKKGFALDKITLSKVVNYSPNGTDNAQAAYKVKAEFKHNDLYNEDGCLKAIYTTNYRPQGQGDKAKVYTELAHAVGFNVFICENGMIKGDFVYKDNKANMSPEHLNPYRAMMNMNMESILSTYSNTIRELKDNTIEDVHNFIGRMADDILNSKQSDAPCDMNTLFGIENGVVKMMYKDKNFAIEPGRPVTKWQMYNIFTDAPLKNKENIADHIYDHANVLKYIQAYK